jgi:hypothetical protein
MQFENSKTNFGAEISRCSWYTRQTKMGKHSCAPKVFSRRELDNDVFELVVDGDLFGGPLFEQFDPARELSERATPWRWKSKGAERFGMWW